MRNRHISIRRAVGLCLLGLLLTGAASSPAAVDLRFTPTDTTVLPSGTGRLSIMIDDPNANVRTIDVYVTYDPAVVKSLGGGAGLKYTQSGFFVFQGIEHNIPGQWHGYAVVMGATDFLTGPGELFYWNFEGLADGVSPIVAVEAYVAAGNGVYYPDVQLDGTTIVVDDPLSAVGDVPLRLPGLEVWPNPFNPAAFVLFELPQAGWARLAVYDLNGREVALLGEREYPAGPVTLRWDGRDDRGRPQPAGQYLFRLQSGGGQRLGKAVLLK